MFNPDAFTMGNSLSATARPQRHNIKTNERGWLDAELEALRKWYPKGGHRIAAKHLPNRSKSSIYSMAHELNIKFRSTNRAAQWLDVELVANGLGVTPDTIVLWVKHKGLNAKHKDGTYRITTASLRRWIGLHPKTINLSKVDREWFIRLAFPTKPN